MIEYITAISMTRETTDATNAIINHNSYDDSRVVSIFVFYNARFLLAMGLCLNHEEVVCAPIVGDFSDVHCFCWDVFWVCYTVAVVDSFSEIFQG